MGIHTQVPFSFKCWFRCVWQWILWFGTSYTLFVVIFIRTSYKGFGPSSQCPKSEYCRENTWSFNLFLHGRLEPEFLLISTDVSTLWTTTVELCFFRFFKVLVEKRIHSFWLLTFRHPSDRFQGTRVRERDRRDGRDMSIRKRGIWPKKIKRYIFRRWEVEVKSPNVGGFRFVCQDYLNVRKRKSEDLRNLP